MGTDYFDDHANMSYVMLAWARMLVGETTTQGETVERLLRQIRGSSRTFVFSAEALCMMNQERVSAIVTALRQEFDELVAIGYVRPPRSLINSWAQQRLKRGFPLETDGPSSLPAPRYREMFSPWLQELGQTRCRIIALDPNTLIGGHLISDFATRVGLEKLVSEEDRCIRMNQSISMATGNLLAAFNETIRHLEQDERESVCAKLILSGPLQDGPPYRLPFDIECRLLASCEDQIRWMESRLGRSLAAIDDPECEYQNDFDHKRLTPELQVAIARLHAHALQTPRKHNQDLPNHNNLSDGPERPMVVPPLS